MTVYREQPTNPEQPGVTRTEVVKETRTGLGAEGRPVEQRAERVRQGAEERAEDLRERAAGGLHSAAEQLRQQGAERGQADLAGRVAGSIDRGAEYLSSHSWTEIRTDVSEQAQEHPVWAAAGVFTAAFLVGRFLRR